MARRAVAVDQQVQDLRRSIDAQRDGALKLMNAYVADSECEYTKYTGAGVVTTTCDAFGNTITEVTTKVSRPNPYGQIG